MKDKVTNYCGLAVAVCGAVKIAETQGVVLPQSVDSALILISAISLGLIGFYTGKKSEGQ